MNRKGGETRARSGNGKKANTKQKSFTNLFFLQFVILSFPSYSLIFSLSGNKKVDSMGRINVVILFSYFSEDFPQLAVELLGM